MCKAGFLALAVLAGSADATTVCDGMAERLRTDPAFMSGTWHGSPFVHLAKRGVIFEAKGETLDSAAVIARLHLMGKAAEAANTLLTDKGMLFALRDHAMLREESGSAGCQTFAFFRSVGGKTEMMAGPPRWMDGGLHEAQKGEAISECFGSMGHFATLDGATGFFAVHGGYDGFSSSTDFVPAAGNAWGPGCSLTVDTEILYPVKLLKLAGGSPLKRDALAQLAPVLAKAFAAAGKPWRFAYGPALDAADLAPLQALADAVYHGKASLPLADEAAPEDDHSIDSITPLAIDGSSFLLKISHRTMGWRDLGGFRLSFYRLARGKPAPVAFVEIDEVAGRVKQISARKR